VWVSNSHPLPIGSRSVEDETKYYEGRRAVSIAGLPVAECVGFDFLAAGEHTSAAQKKPTKCAACSPTKCEKTEWMWATNLPTAQASTASV
jgi:hypothetical protein